MVSGQQNTLHKLKINQVVTEDQNEIEEEVLKFFNSLFNGHHNVDLADTGTSFEPDFFKFR